MSQDQDEQVSQQVSPGKGALPMQAVMDKRVNGVATAPVSSPRVLALFVVLAVNPACSPNQTARVAGQAATWPDRPTPIDEAPTWEDAAWQ
jgi:hypothetical protein